MGFWLNTWLKYDFDQKRVPYSRYFPDLVAPRYVLYIGRYQTVTYIGLYMYSSSPKIDTF